MSGIRKFVRKVSAQPDARHKLNHSKARRQHQQPHIAINLKFVYLCERAYGVLAHCYTFFPQKLSGTFWNSKFSEFITEFIAFGQLCRVLATKELNSLNRLFRSVYRMGLCRSEIIWLPSFFLWNCRRRRGANWPLFRYFVFA